MADTFRLSPARSVVAALGVLTLTLGLLAYAPSAHARQPGDGSTGDGSAEIAQTDSGISLRRHQGQTRYQTSAQIATDTYDASTDVVIASGETFADALSGAALEGLIDAPVLLVPEDLVDGQIPQATTDAINDLGATTATILGGPDAVSDGVVDHIVDGSTVQITDRVFGPTRFETAREIAERVGDAGLVPDAVADQFGLTQDANAAFLATGLNWPDAMAAGPGSFADQHPILLTTPNQLHSAAQAGLEAASADVVFILGGTEVVSDGVESELTSQGYETVRLAGADRWETAKEVADTFADDWGYGVGNVGLATGFTFADALASAPFLGNPAPLVLTPTGETHPVTTQFFQERGCDIDTVDVFGGQQAVETAVAQSYADAACPPADQGSISGTVTAAGTGTPIADADITASSAETFTATTDVDGDYAMDVDAPETYTVTAEADDFQDGEQQVQVDANEDVADVDFQLSPVTNQDVPVSPEESEAADVSLSPQGDVNLTGTDHTTTATVTDEFGNPVAGAEVTFALDAADSRDRTVTRTTDADGQASFTYSGPDSLPLDDPLNEGDDADQISADVAAIDGSPDAQTIKEWSEGIVTNTATDARYLSDELGAAEDDAASGETLAVTGTVLGGETLATAGLTLTGDGTIALSEALDPGDTGTPTLTVSALGTVVEDLTIRRSGDTADLSQGILVEGEGATGDAGIVLRNLAVEGDLADVTNAGIMVRPAGDDADFLSGVAVENNDVSGFASGVSVTLLQSDGMLPAGPPTLDAVVIDGNTIDASGLGVALGTPEDAGDTPGGVVVSANTISATGTDSFGVWLNSQGVLDASAITGNDVGGDEPYAGVRGEEADAVAQTLATGIAAGNAFPDSDVYHTDNFGDVVPAWVIGDDPG